jgi:hypothetical protein
LSPIQRAIAIFARPSSAWADLTTRSQWWFPLLILVVLSVANSVILHERALMPMLMEQWEAQVESGQLPADRLDAIEGFMSSPAGIAVTAGQTALVWPILMLLYALMVWFGVGFILGTKFRYRLAFEVVCWSSLVLIPATLLTTVLAWSKETMKGVHVGLGALLPEADVPSKLQTGLAIFLDGLGPLQIWSLVVSIIGASVLSGAPRKSVGWVMGGLYVAMMVFMAALAAVFSPG